MFVFAGLPVVFEPDEALSPAERAALRELATPDAVAFAGTPFRIVLEDRETSVSAEAPAAAQVSWQDGRCRLDHALFDSTVDPLAAVARVRRGDGSPVGLITTLRIVLGTALPLRGGLVLHAAGLEREGRGLVFFGPSGIGKSTLAGRSPWPVLSDELVALLPRKTTDPRQVSGTAFRRPPPGSAKPKVPEPQLECLVELAQGPRFRLDRLEPRAALRRILGSITVPPGPPLWTAALKVVGDLPREVPCYRMEWSLDESPFEPLAEALRL